MFLGTIRNYTIFSRARIEAKYVFLRSTCMITKRNLIFYFPSFETQANNESPNSKHAKLCKEGREDTLKRFTAAL